MTNADPQGAQSTGTGPISGLWWIGALRGAFAIIFGIFALVWPGITVGALVLLFGVYAIFDGLVAIFRGFGDRRAGWGWWVALGVTSIIAGILAFAWPGITVMALLWVVAFYAIVFGIFEIGAGWRLRELPGSDWGWTLAGGVLAVIFGLLLIIWPGSGIITLIWLVGWYAIIFGIVLIAGSFTFRNRARDLGL